MKSGKENSMSHFKKQLATERHALCVSFFCSFKINSFHIKCISLKMKGEKK